MNSWYYLKKGGYPYQRARTGVLNDLNDITIILKMSARKKILVTQTRTPGTAPTRGFFLVNIGFFVGAVPVVRCRFTAIFLEYF